MISLEEAPARVSARSGVAGVRLAYGLAVALLVLVRIPTLVTPFTMDDYAQIAMMDGDYPSAHTGPFDQYDFVDDADRTALMERGILPWWIHPKLVVRFFRPLSSLLLYIDHHLFGRNALACHVHSLAWWALACVALYALIKQTLSERVARIAVLVFALSPCHVTPLAWVANREALVSTALGIAALGFYARWRESGREKNGARDAAAAFALFALAMTAGEYSVCFGGYVLAIEAVYLLRRPEPLWRRILGVSVFLVPTIAYVVARSSLGYGARYCGLYHDPSWNFARFSEGAPRRFGVLLSIGWLGFDLFRALLMPGPMLVAVLVVAAVVAAVPLRGAFVALDPRRRLNATWLLVGSYPAMIPMIAVEANPRLLGIAMIGISAAVALAIDRVWFPLAPEPRRGTPELAAVIALVLAFIHIVRAPIDDWLAGRVTTAVAQGIDRDMAWTHDRLAGKSLAVVIRGESPMSAIFSPCMLGDEKNVPWRILSYEAGRVLVLRTGDRTLELVASPKPIFPMVPRLVFRDYDGTLRPGESVEVGAMKATVLQLDKDGMPRRIRYEFDRSLDDKSILWLRESEGKFFEQPLPKAGFGEPIDP
jgi:hypothetical protein